MQPLGLEYKLFETESIRVISRVGCSECRWDRCPAIMEGGRFTCHPVKVKGGALGEMPLVEM